MIFRTAFEEGLRPNPRMDRAGDIDVFGDDDDDALFNYDVDAEFANLERGIAAFLHSLCLVYGMCGTRPAR